MKYLLSFEHYDKRDTTTSDGFSGGAVGWCSEKQVLEAESDKDAKELARNVIRGTRSSVRSVGLWKAVNFSLGRKKK